MKALYKRKEHQWAIERMKEKKITERKKKVKRGGNESNKIQKAADKNER